jgi:DNA-binding protein H-NS
LENEEGSDREEMRAEQTFQKQESRESEKQAEAEGVSLLQITQKVKKQSAYFEQAVKDNSNPETITNLMFTPLRENTAQIFEVHVYSSLTEKRFELWMDSLPMMKLLMAA